MGADAVDGGLILLPMIGEDMAASRAVVEIGELADFQSFVTKSDPVTEGTAVPKEIPAGPSARPSRHKIRELGWRSSAVNIRESSRQSTNLSASMFAV
jgi:hypothetical protein